MASVLHIFRAPKKRLPMEEMDEARVNRNAGLEGCAHARPGGSRQVLLVDRETLEAMDLRPGVIRENITTDGINVNSLAVGQELRVGEALLKVSAICHPCDQLEKIRPGLRQECAGDAGCCAGWCRAEWYGAGIPSRKLRRRGCCRWQKLQGTGFLRSEGALGGRVLSSVFSTGSSGGTIQLKPRCSSMVPRMNLWLSAIRGKAARRKSAESAAMAF